MKKMLFASFFSILLALSVARADQRVVIPLENSPAQGPEHAPVAIVEFIDFQ